MPTCTRDGLDKKTIAPKDFQDDEKVFFCETTGEIFRDYEDYFKRVMVINSTIWACEITGQDNLTYAEALKSERRARRKQGNLTELVRAPALLIVDASFQTSFQPLLHLIYHFLKERFFLGEEVNVCKSKYYLKCKIVSIIKPNKAPENEIYDPKSIKYKVQKIKNQTETWVTTPNYIRRGRANFTHDTLKAFLKESITIDDERLYKTTEEAYKKYITDKKFKFDEMFAGKLPEWKRDEKKLARLNRSQEENKKQSSMSNYLVKNNGDNDQSVKRSKESEVNLKKEMERLRREKEEIERKRAELLVKIEEEVSKIATKCDDLERVDQRLLPVYKPVNSLVPAKYFGDFLMIQEFINSFAPILSLKDVFKKTVTTQQMNRAFLVREVAGPLSDIVQVLLSTIFCLQIEEEDECEIKYVKSNKTGYMWETANKAVATHTFIKKHYALELYNLPIDAQTLSELLRLHLLASGAPTNEKSERWRFQYRNGYSVTEDPGLLLRIQNPHIMRALKMYTIYQLPFKDILKVLNCLVEQILTYYGCVNLVEERLENYIKARSKLRTYMATENKRAMNMTNLKKKIVNEHHIDITENEHNPERKAELERAMNRKINDLNLQDERERRNFEYEIDLIREELFNYMLYLGSDRAYRKYYVFESIPGLFIEHPSDSFDHCLDNPPKNVEVLAKCPHSRKDIRVAVSKLMKEVDKENVNNTPVEKTVENQNILENGEVIKINGTSGATTTPPPLENNVNKPPPTQYELFMCTGEPNHCIVHDPKNTDRVRWSYLHTENDLKELIESLNPYSNRESALKIQLEELQKIIITHIKDCPTDLLTIDENDMEKYKAQMINETQKKYANSNFGSSIESDLNDVMYDTLLEQIMQLELNVSNGYLGKLQVADIEKWRNDLMIHSYDSQCETLSYGVEVSFEDPGENLGDTIDIESEDSADELISLHDSPNLRQNVHHLASALLQIEQSIDQKFLKEPFGVKNENAKDVESILLAGKDQLLQWETSLMNATNYSQVFLHYNLLSDAIKWNKSSTQSKCLVCKRKGDADQLLLCDECNAGTHMFCMKPPLKVVPEGNWYCAQCEEKLGLKKEPPKRKYRRKKVFTYNGEENEDKETKLDESLRGDEEWKIADWYKNKKVRNKTTHYAHRSYKKLMADPDDDDGESEEEEDDEQMEEEQCEEDVENTENREELKEQLVKKSTRSKNKNKSDKPKPKNSKKINHGQYKDSSDEEMEDETNTDEYNTDERETPVSDEKDDTVDEWHESQASDSSSSRLYKKKKKIVKSVQPKLNKKANCNVCTFHDCDISCATCKMFYHLECIPLRRLPRGVWLCAKCKKKPETKKRKAADVDEDSDSSESDVPLAKRKREINGKTGQNTSSNGIEDVSKNNNNSRRGRRTGDNLPLNSVILYDLLDDIMKHDDAWPFLRPVSQTEVPDYYEIIKDPMDFAKVKSKLNMARYTFNEELMKDIELIFRNCDTYNTEGNEIYLTGASLEKFVVQKCKEFNLPFKPSDMIANTID